VGELPIKSLYPSCWISLNTVVPELKTTYPVKKVPRPRADYTGPYCDYDRFLLRRALCPVALLLRVRGPRMLARFLTTAFATRRTRGLAPATFSLNAFCTVPAFVAIVPRCPNRLCHARENRLVLPCYWIVHAQTPFLAPTRRGSASAILHARSLKLVVAPELLEAAPPRSPAPAECV
jgi:hypothetical protein